jgi:hypothetical protein
MPLPLNATWRYRLALGLSWLSLALFALTMVQPQWVEWLFDEAPDGGDGSFERWVVGGAFLAAALAAAAVARRQRRELARAG